MGLGLGLGSGFVAQPAVDLQPPPEPPSTARAARGAISIEEAALLAGADADAVAAL